MPVGSELARLGLFVEGSPRTAFRHIGGLITAAGVSVQTYDLDGHPRYGSCALPDDAPAVR
ncbi:MULTISPECIES: hypothetical protein [unclassified Streptomyces]|uniref:hypothetical protein n=1 Tax=unclassified Streptomyces TaxID=2593676 RepID=UPI003820C242